MIEKKEFKDALTRLIQNYDDNSFSTAEILHQVLEDFYYEYQNEAIERFAIEQE